MSEFSMYMEFEDETKAQSASTRLQNPEELRRLKRKDPSFEHIDRCKGNGNPRVIQVDLDFYATPFVAPIGREFGALRISANMSTIWEQSQISTTGARS